MATLSDQVFLPALPQFEIERAAQLIQQAYAHNVHISSEDQRRLQAELFEIQKRPEAWGLVVPFTHHSDQSVQFFGAHTIQVKISRDWETFPQENAPQLRNLLLEIATYSIASGRNKVVLRKLFVAITALAIKLVPSRPPVWPNWVLACVSMFSGKGASTENILDFLAIVAEEVETAQLSPNYKSSMKESLSDGIPLVIHAVTTSISQRSTQPVHELHSALKCLEAWMPILPADQLTPLTPLLISLLDPSPGPIPQFDETTFIPASDALQELMTNPPFSDGSGSKTLTEPLLVWLGKWGRSIVQATITNGFADSVSHSLCKLLVAFGDQSSSYFAANIASTACISSASAFTKSELVQVFLSLLLSYTGLPGYACVDEEESEMTLSFWYLFQEALWSTDYHPGFFEEGEVPQTGLDGEQAKIIGALYQQLVQILRRKVAWPSGMGASTWSKDQVEKFQIYRRDVGDALINAYYILRKDLTSYFVNDVVQRLQNRQDHDDWTEIEATLHCIMAIQEAAPIEASEHLSRLFGTEILARLPTTGTDRVRRTALVLIGSYASWFTTQPSMPMQAPSPLMTAISYVVSALSDPSLCLPGANALRNLCDSNRIALAPHITAFGELHAGLAGIPDTERAKVLQSIASVIQALSPEEEIPPVETIVNPIISRLFEAIQLSSRLPQDALVLAIQQLQSLTGISKGLTRVSESLLLVEETLEARAELNDLEKARQDPRMVKLREAILNGVKLVVEIWSTDAGAGDAISDLIKAMTALQSDATLLSLPAGPLLDLVSIAAQRQLTAVWLSLTSMLIIQLDPPTLFPSTRNPTPSSEAQTLVTQMLPQLLQTSLTFLGQPGAMEEHPDIVQAFFSCMESFAQHFMSRFYELPPETFDALIQCSIVALALQERYSMVSGCSFICSVILKTFTNDRLSEAKTILIERYGRRIMYGILSGLVGVAPRSVVPNLVTLLHSFLIRCPAETNVWTREILYATDFLSSKAGPEEKEKFLNAISSSRSLKRKKEAANHLALVARGLEGSGFGYGASTM